jgi:undecaprenyl diphosphate synthase
VPAHVAIIMDGNGRWAKKRLMNRIRGHEKGVDTVRNIVRACCELNISALTLYVFSTENWQRPQSEIRALMALLKRFLIKELPELQEQKCSSCFT